MTNYLDTLPAVSFDCYSANDQILHLNFRDHVLRRVSEVTFESIFLSVINYDFDFELSTPHGVPFRLKMRSPKWSFEKDYQDVEEAIEAAFAGYRHCIAKPLHDNLVLPAPILLIVDENGQTINFEEVRQEVAERETCLIASKVLTFEGKYIRGRIIPAVDGTFITTVVHLLNGAVVVADHPFYDPLHATKFVQFYLENFDRILLPKALEVTQSSALSKILN